MTDAKTVVITGASTGIGLAIAKAYLALGYNVVGNSRSREKLEAAADELGNPANFLIVPGDIGDRATSIELFDRALAAFGQIDVLVNNAGIFIAKPFEDFTEADVDAIVSTNLKGFVYPSQIAAKLMKEQGFGHIVAISATIAMQPNVKLPCMLSTLIKGGINHAVKGLALELASSNVQVNAVAPGIIDTPIHSRGDEMWSFLRGLAPTGKTGVPEDIADAVVFLTNSTFITGAILPVDGGSTTGVWS
ncbi:SDR family oxidoreductase [Agrobacterium tumefaciens]|uniref:SDR family NAD(P)-dependent oxidoreductase n=1 Tax=Agrobacterium tumefaciens TaxID=358 RepID=UPI001574BE86|nr:SDR family oxidoreductase [Agrobacterium tumefaciens]NSZ03181.1 SDR family oxidoreductase [Agrobacterium tumefaciens]NSZ39796.1 SDR family oxidoreductase [Agrobacterium tumefaciens]NTB26754.1 SDR family oxidoreductase [Agrobacterium tumefaciens]NTB31852.1 SDR family oxidoreductase [Agrobacterium tumefaciens]NTB34297.1 SDR family oxidoreductase [Agrobacterium tumefaciens]